MCPHRLSQTQNTLHAVFIDPSLGTSMRASISCFSHPPCHCFPSSTTASSPSLIFYLSLYLTQGINHLIPWQQSHPCRCMWALRFLSVWVFCTPTVPASYQSKQRGLWWWRCSPALPFHSEWLWQLSSRDALTCHTWLPLSSVQNNDQIQRKKYPERCQACFVSV